MESSSGMRGRRSNAATPWPTDASSLQSIVSDHETPVGGDGIEFLGGSFVAGTSGEILSQAGLDESVLLLEVDLCKVDVTRTHWPFCAIAASTRTVGLRSDYSMNNDENNRRQLAWVTGASGLIGSHVVQSAESYAPEWEIRGLSRKDFDLTDFPETQRQFESRTTPD